MRTPFVWAAWVLRDEPEATMRADDMAALITEIESLENSVRTTQMSPYLRDFIERQIKTIRAALRLYRVQGVRPLQEALRKVAGDLAFEGQRVEAEHAKASAPAKSVLANVGSFIKKFAEVCDQFEKVRKAGEGAWALAQKAPPVLIAYIEKLISNS